MWVTRTRRKIEGREGRSSGRRVDGDKRLGGERVEWGNYERPRGGDELDRWRSRRSLQRSSFRVDKVRFAQCVFPMGQSSGCDLRELRFSLVIRGCESSRVTLGRKIYCVRSCRRETFFKIASMQKGFYLRTSKIL